MTKHQRTFSASMAIHGALAEFNDETIKRITGKSASLVRKWASEDCEYNHFPFEQAITLAAHLRFVGVKERFTEAFSHAIARKVDELGGAPAHQPIQPLARLAHIMKEVGDIACEIQAATDPSSSCGSEISLAESHVIEKELLEARDAIDAALKDFDGRK